ncbi:hypothetical protein M2432_000318 [Mycobacterium sp. OTB74]|jgi:hypothetical protein|nr:hypothetical protein [Mycobacterium sp. OTB74]
MVLIVCVSLQTMPKAQAETRLQVQWTRIGIFPQSAPAMGSGQVGAALADGDWATVVCEAQGQAVGNGDKVIDIWDRLGNGAWLPNAFLKTNADGWTPGIPRCSDFLNRAAVAAPDRAANPGDVQKAVSSPCGEYVESWHWMNQGGVKRLAVTPTTCGFFTAFANVQASFDEMYHKANLNWGGDQYWSAWNQWACHASFWWSKMRTEWHLEPSRPNVGFWPTVFAECNP